MNKELSTLSHRDATILPQANKRARRRLKDSMHE